ncbi:phenylalanine--tRNA ligase subunit beta [Alicyclobacillus sp.]|uniref:phenylalanine--tRNA ligase subunit beta n=1 Tax=Alicyclobacillus sp. TaxID=61169 RepID=UPI0025BDABE9|nr:phenylalanine--tRNA ligase subunit beta [Alicyclobacillus sp.]MCL6517803.1 phenylalanine--tRNA ligase subunit beta [Alicyclobacillus sp.]
MRLSYQWLCEYVDVRDISPRALAERLTAAGLEVEALTPRNRGVSGVVVGHVLTCEPHPNGDRLKVCTVDAGAGEPLTIVCGAPNVRAGQRVPTALPGATLPGGPIKRVTIRGVESNGMLCSAEELGLEVKLLPKDLTEGLFVLPEDTPVGEDIVKLLQLDDVILEIGLTPNRSDCLSMRGLAYEVGALYDRPVRFSPPSEPSVPEPSPVRVSIETERCARYDAQVVSGLIPRPSPLWMQMRLLAMGIRPINLMVDVTNYVMLEWGQPLHAFDFEQVREGHIIVRQAGADERLVTLDGQERVLNDDTIVIADPERAIGIAGVMGGENSEVRSSTRRVVIESATFDAASVRRTGQRLGLRSEAQQRFEKGVDPVAVRAALVRAAQLLCDLGGGRREGGVVSVTRGEAAVARRLEFSPERCNRLLGTDIPPSEMRAVFRRLGFSVQERDAGAWEVDIPTRRPDIALEADLAEEIARLIGYGAIPSTLPFGATTVGVRTPSQRLRRRTREVLTGLGMTEVFTYALTHPSSVDALGLAADSPYRQMIPLRMPMSEERSVLRTHLLPSLAQVAQYNLARDVAGGQIFEIARVYWPRRLPLDAQPCERTQWAGLWFGTTDADVWNRARRYDFYDAKGAVEVWLEAFGWLDGAEFRPAASPWLHPGRAAEVWLSGMRIGSFGELHPKTAASLELEGAVYAEFDLDLVVERLSDRWLVEPLPRHPAARRDLAVVVHRDVMAQDLLRVAEEAVHADGERLLEDIRVFDVYTGPGVPEDKKSVAIRLTFRSKERTLTDEEVDRLVQRVLSVWTARFAAALRG